MKYEIPDTLSYFKSAPQMHRVDLSHIPVKNFGEATKAYRKYCELSSPDSDAVTFYTYNHLMSILSKNFTPHETLPPWAVELGIYYLRELSNQGNRMLHYILSICTREMRHLHTGSVVATFYSTLEKDYGGDFKEFLTNKICTGNEDSSVNNYMNNAPEVSVGKYISGLAWAFYNGKWSSGYGGKAWGQVADACVSFIYGKISMEALVDTGYTLCHNGGPIFNKGMMYEGYSPYLNTLLDVQRSGQVPELLLDSNNYNVKKPDHLVSVVKKFKTEYPSEFRGWVDWLEVEKLGAVGKYAPYIQKQKLQHPQVIKPVIIKTTDGTSMKEIGIFEVMPGVQVKKLQRVAA